MKRKAVPQEILTLMAEKFRLLSDATRLAILNCLIDGKEMNVSQLVQHSGQELANVSKNLTAMAKAGLLLRRKEGTFVYYQLKDPIVKQICELVCESLRHKLEVEMKRNRDILRRGKLN